MSPYLYISDINKQMLSVGIKLFSAGQVQDYGSQMAAATLVLLPIIVVFLFCQRFFIENATSSACLLLYIQFIDIKLLLLK